MFLIMKLKYEAPIYVALALGLTLKDILKV